MRSTTSEGVEIQYKDVELCNLRTHSIIFTSFSAQVCARGRGRILTLPSRGQGRNSSTHLLAIPTFLIWIFHTWFSWSHWKSRM